MIAGLLEETAMIKNLFSKLLIAAGLGPTPQAQLERLMARPVSEFDLNKLFPIIMPSGILHINWPGPTIALGDLPFALTWTVAEENHIFAHVSDDMQKYWEGKDVDWRARAKDNLIKLAWNDPSSGEKCDETGKPFIKAMLNKDSIGPSRLLVPHLFERELGQDYLVSIPEQTCAIAYKSILDVEQQEIVDEVIDGCFTDGTEPMSPERFRPERFWVL